jgi:hypothetical protein
MPNFNENSLLSMKHLQSHHWLLAAVVLPFVTIWMYLVGIYFQAGYFDYFNIPSTFAETLPAYLLIAWLPIAGYGLSFLITSFLTLELLSRWLTTNRTFRSFMMNVLTYLALLLLILIPQYHGLIPDGFAKYEIALWFIIVISHIAQWARWGHIFTEDSMSFYLARNFGVLIVLLIIAYASLPYVYEKGLQMASKQTSYQTFGENPEYAVVFIGSKYLFAMPVDGVAKTLRDELKTISLDNLDESLVNKNFGTGALTIVPSTGQ